MNIFQGPETFKFFADDQAQYKLFGTVQVHFFLLRLCTTVHNYSVAHPQMPHLKSAHGRILLSSTVFRRSVSKQTRLTLLTVHNLI